MKDNMINLFKNIIEKVEPHGFGDFTAIFNNNMNYYICMEISGKPDYVFYGMQNKNVP